MPSRGLASFASPCKLYKMAPEVLENTSVWILFLPTSPPRLPHTLLYQRREFSIPSLNQQVCVHTFIKRALVQMPRGVRAAPADSHTETPIERRVARVTCRFLPMTARRDYADRVLEYRKYEREEKKMRAQKVRLGCIKIMS